jgi:hypothetical protein
MVSLVGSLPAGTTFGVVCAPLGIDARWDVSQGRTQTTSGITPPGFDGSVTSWASLPSGATRWPAGARLDTTVYVGVPNDAPAAVYAAPLDELRLDANAAKDLAPNARLVRLGNCATVFSSS